jgi:hypothetical protein
MLVLQPEVAAPRPRTNGTNEMTSNQHVLTRPTNVWAVAAFVVSLFGWYASPILSGIFACVALHQIQQRGERGRTLALFAPAFAFFLTAVHIVLVLSGHQLS